MEVGSHSTKKDRIRPQVREHKRDWKQGGDVFRAYRLRHPSWFENLPSLWVEALAGLMVEASVLVSVVASDEQSVEGLDEAFAAAPEVNPGLRMTSIVWTGPEESSLLLSAGKRLEVADPFSSLLLTERSARSDSYLCAFESASPTTLRRLPKLRLWSQRSVLAVRRVRWDT